MFDTMENREERLGNTIYTPAQVSTYGVEAIRRAEKEVEKGIGLGISNHPIDAYFAPVHPGQVCGIIAQTSNYKSGFMDFIERQYARKLSANGVPNVALVHISLEESIEEQALRVLGTESGESANDLAQGIVKDWDVILAAANRISEIPIFRVGHSLARTDEDIADLYLSNLIRIVGLLRERLDEVGIIIGGLFFDYLQAFPPDPEVRGDWSDANRRLQVRSDVFRIFRAASYFQAPTFVNIQAKEPLGGNNPPMFLPGTYDGQETSSIAQRFDRLVSLWLPKMNYAPGTMVTVKGGVSFVVKENMLWIKVCKQRGMLPSGRSWPFDVDYATNIINPPDNAMSWQT